MLYFMQRHLYFVVSEVYLLRLFACFRCCTTSEKSNNASTLLCILQNFSCDVLTLLLYHLRRVIMSFFRQLSVVVHKHMTLGFINGYCVQPCVRMCDKYKYSCAVLLTRLSICFMQALLNETTV